ncbi:MAG: SGNH/GDSL hydrolase family protein [Bacteroidota bacterium]
MVRIIQLAVGSLLLWGLACEPSVPPQEKEPITNPVEATGVSFLALGDSYTIGESVPKAERWPVQLAAKLLAEGTEVSPPTIIARTGWTTDELQAAIAASGEADTFGLVSLLIGVNNQYRGYPFAQYETEFVALLQRAIAFAEGDPKRVFVVSIPDYGATPFGQSGDPDKIGRELDRYNAYADSICQAREIPFFNITPISREAVNDPELVASDNLHPSAKMYGQWVDLLWEEVKELVK